jgi:hypothetical protein
MTRDTARAMKDIEASGFCIIPDVLPADRLARVREALYRAASEEPGARLGAEVPPRLCAR